MSRTRTPGLLVASAVALLTSNTASGQQAWLPPKGEASLSLGFANLLATDHRNYQGRSVYPGEMIWNNVVADVSYSITDRLAVRLNLPLVISKYDGAYPHPPVAGRENLDDGRWHETFQDLQAEVRFRATKGSLVVTPFVSLVVPTHYYEYYGHGAAGRKLVEGQVGVVAGRLLDPLLPNAYLQVRYLFAKPEKVLGVSHDRSQLAFDLGYLFGSAFSVRALGAWQAAHGGWRVPIDWPALTSPEYRVHDQLNRSDYFRLGGAVSYALTGSLDVTASGYGTLWARNDVNMRGLGISLTWSVSPAQLIRKKRHEGKDQP
jgi:hypothetical protein